MEIHFQALMPWLYLMLLFNGFSISWVSLALLHTHIVFTVMTGSVSFFFRTRKPDDLTGRLPQLWLYSLCLQSEQHAAQLIARLSLYQLSMSYLHYIFIFIMTTASEWLL